MDKTTSQKWMDSVKTSSFLHKLAVAKT